MKIYFTGDKIEYGSPAIALGNFDGVHAGHLHIIERAREAGESFGVLLFEKHTSNMTGKGVKVITPLYEKLRILSELGADFVYLVNFDKRFMSMGCEEFAKYINELGIYSVSVGYDYKFGKNAAGDAALIKELLAVYGIKTMVSDAVTVDGCPVKSSRIRELISDGKMLEANKLLTRPLRLSGIVVSGFQNGRKMGFPTANLECPDEILLPQDGVYYGECIVDGERYSAVVNVGKNPTFNAGSRTVESHIIGYDDDLYGCRISVEFFEKIRGEMRFDSVSALKEQIARDKEYAIKRGK